MFKKKPQFKNLAPLRSSDRRKLADQIIKDYNVHVPPTPSEPSAQPQSIPELAPDHENTTNAPTLTTIRASLLPESSQSARFSTTTGPNAAPVSGTIYVGAHEEQQERIMWFQIGQDKQMYPTVYTLWSNPGLVPLLHTPNFVVGKLKGGADMMTPGLLDGPPWPEAATKGSVVAMASSNPGKDTVPVWIGVCEIDVSALGDVRGSKGRAIKGLHCVGDELWSWSSTPGLSGMPEPESLAGWEATRRSDRDTGPASIEHGMEDLELGDEDEEEEGGVALAPPHADSHTENGDTEGHDQNDDEQTEVEPTTAEVDSAFMSAFLYSIHTAKKHNQGPSYGFALPIQPSSLISNMIQPYLRSQSSHYTIKKTSWKNTKKFIKYLDKQGLLKSKDRNGGETIILDLDFDDIRVQNFTPYKLPKPKPTSDPNDIASSKPTITNGHTDPSIGQTLNLIHLFRPSPRLVPDLLPSKTSFYTQHQVSSQLKTYITSHPETTSNPPPTNPRHIKINPFIANNIMGTNPSATDTKYLSTHEIPRDYLLTRLLSDTTLLTPFWTLSSSPDHTTSTYSPSHPDPSLPKPKPLPSPSVHLLIEKRTGSKLVTRITGLEQFHINPNLLAPELQKKCAGSASVSQAVGGKVGAMEVLVQGDQRDVVISELGRRGVRKEWVEVVDKGKGKGKGR